MSLNISLHPKQHVIKKSKSPTYRTIVKMFQFKRNFALNGPSPGSSASRINQDNQPLALGLSPIKKIRLSSPLLALRDSPMKVRMNDEPQTSAIGSPVKPLKLDSELGALSRSILSSPIKEVKVDTPPATPDAQPSKVAIRDELRDELERLNCQVDYKFNHIKDFVNKKSAFGGKRLFIEDLKEMAHRAQCDVRNLCNEIFNPGVEMAKRCTSLIEESKRNHSNKYEKLSFDLTERMDATEITIRRKREELNHELQLYERTLATIEAQRVQKEEAAERESAMDQNGNGQEEREQECEVVEVIEQNEVDVISIKDGSNDVESGREADAASDETDIDEEVVMENADEDKTEIDSNNDEPVERSFTPCQAQRPA